MNLLLDTHAFLWWLAGDAELSQAAQAATALPSSAIAISAASVWEIATKHRLGKLPQIGAIVADLESHIETQGFTALPISARHGRVAGTLPGPHRDPFDRMLIAQAMVDNLVLVSNERPFDLYGIARLW